MIRIIFDNGGTADLLNVEKLYIEEEEMDKVTVLSSIKQWSKEVNENERSTN